MLNRLGTALLVICAGIFAANQELSAATEALVLHVVDQQGDPVAGAFVGSNPVHPIKQLSELFMFDATGWGYPARNHWVTDEHGHVTIDNRSTEQNTFLVIRHANRRLMAFEEINWKKAEDVREVVMRPEIRVSGKWTCRDLESADRSLPYVTVQVRRDGSNVLRFLSNNGEYHLPMIPGEYTLKFFANSCFPVTTSCKLTTRESARFLDPVDLPAAQKVLLQGRPAPELHDVAVWKGTDPVRLSELKGKVILLDFWGYWCGPCLRDMPYLFQLHDKYADKGLVIIGLHVDTLQDDVHTPEDLDSQLAPIRNELWHGRDIPFPVALTKVKPVRFNDRITDMARCPLAASYGVWYYPTSIVIDREGMVVGELHLHREDERQRLEQMLTEQ